MHLNVIQCTNISFSEVLLLPVCAAFLGCQQIEKKSEKSFKTVPNDRQPHTPLHPEEEFKKEKKKSSVPALEPTVRTRPPTTDRYDHFLFFLT